MAKQTRRMRRKRVRGGRDKRIRLGEKVVLPDHIIKSIESTDEKNISEALTADVSDILKRINNEWKFNTKRDFTKLQALYDTAINAELSNNADVKDLGVWLDDQIELQIETDKVKQYNPDDVPQSVIDARKNLSVLNASLPKQQVNGVWDKPDLSYGGGSRRLRKTRRKRRRRYTKK